LQAEVELLDGLEEGKVGLMDGALQTSLLAVGNLLTDEHSQKLAASPILGLSSLQK
jgi:hypothetical protein